MLYQASADDPPNPELAEDKCHGEICLSRSEEKTRNRLEREMI